MEKKRKAYFYNPSVKIPKTTAWRLQKRVSNSSVLDSALSKRRKTYHHNPNFSVPKSTLWRWKKEAEKTASIREDRDKSNTNEMRYAASDSFDVCSDVGDAGKVYSDVGEVQIDAGEVCSDAGEVCSDAGEVCSNAGEMDSDAGEVDSDADEVDSDAGEVDSVNDYQQPLFKNSTITLEESIFSTRMFAVRNKLSYQATSQLIQLMQMHFPKPNQFPLSRHMLSKHFSPTKNLKITEFCISCSTIIQKEVKSCGNSRCGSRNMSNFVLLLFEDQFADICSGKL